MKGLGMMIKLLEKSFLGLEAISRMIVILLIFVVSQFQEIKRRLGDIRNKRAFRIYLKKGFLLPEEFEE